MSDHNDSQREEYQEQWEDLDEKTILVQMLAELQQIRTLLSDADTGAHEGASNEEGYQCRHCGALVPADDRERHAVSEHKAPPERVDAMFERA
jgi:hypothetical protein